MHTFGRMPGFQPMPNFDQMPGFPPMPLFDPMPRFPPMQMPAMRMPAMEMPDMRMPAMEMPDMRMPGFGNMPRLGNGETFEAFAGFQRTAPNGVVVDSRTFRTNNPNELGHLATESRGAVEAKDKVPECEVEEPPERSTKQHKPSDDREGVSGSSERPAHSEGLREGRKRLTMECFFGPGSGKEASSHLRVIPSQDFQAGHSATDASYEDIEVPANINMKRLMTFLWEGETPGTLVWLRGVEGVSEAVRFRYDDDEVGAIILERLGWKHDDCKQRILLALT